MEPWFDDVDDRPRDAAFIVTAALDDLQCADIDLNRHAAHRAARIVDAVRLARRNPEVFVHPGERDAARSAERAALLDIALRLRCSEEYIRGELFAAEEAMLHLPELWRHACDGFVSMYLVGRTVGALLKVRAPVHADDDERHTAALAMRIIDEAASEWVLSCSPATFLRRLRTLVDRLDPVGGDVRHARAVRDRRVVVTHDEDGMSWISAYLPTIEALAIKRRLASTAKHRQKNVDECRNRDHLRADLFSAWLRGVGSDTAVTTSVFVTIPVQLLATGGADTVPAAQAEIVGHGPIDDLTAKQVFLDAGVFRRVLVDPIHSVVLDMDRRSRHATRAQRDWLILQHGTCARDGCGRLAQDAEIDHRIPWAQGGKTDIDDLRPLCPRDHALRHRTRAIYRSRPDRTVQVITPTGFRSAAPPPVREGPMPASSAAPF